MDGHDAKLKLLRTGIAVKLAVCLLAGAAVILALFSALNLRLHQKHSRELILASAERLSDIILHSTRHEMMNNDRAALYSTIRDIGNEPGIQRVRIFNKEGRISFSTDAAEVGRVVDKATEACYACHAQGVPLERLDGPDSSRMFHDNQGQRVLAMIRPIRNEPSCASAACHVHPAERKVLGVIDVHLSLARVDAQSASQQQWLLWFSAGALVLLCLVSGWFVFVVVHRPIQALIRGTKRVATGDLDHRIDVQSKDELGQLAESFNKMTAELSEAHAEITGWAQQLEERVDRKTEELEKAHRFLLGSEKMAGIGKLAATVAHEVNNPLFGILTYARLCIRDAEKPELDTATRERMVTQLRTIERESRRCGDLIKNLLTYARQAPRKREPNDVNAAAERAMALVRHQMKLTGIDLIAELDPTLPPVSCDAAQVQQVALILLTNAAEATGEGGSVRISTAFDEDTDEVILTVSDDGGGIPPEVLPSIFDPFFTTKEDKLRTGLGLAVAKSIVEQHGGTIEAQSVPAQGATFAVRLPVHETAPRMEAVAAAAYTTTGKA